MELLRTEGRSIPNSEVASSAVPCMRTLPKTPLRRLGCCGRPFQARPSKGVAECQACTRPRPINVPRRGARTHTQMLADSPNCDRVKTRSPQTHPKQDLGLRLEKALTARREDLAEQLLLVDHVGHVDVGDLALRRCGLDRHGRRSRKDAASGASPIDARKQTKVTCTHTHTNARRQSAHRDTATGEPQTS